MSDNAAGLPAVLTLLLWVGVL
ncbi:hypothetical protein AERO8C_70574 [Aeromonas veronii]|uniref:Uncharacterized protein n=1 Tax=Aeromonas veronii TaxID=654 RepID=A0A653LCY3_AERVE|nr:hypothetical protein AERO8C_70574 [Aeromonas veronii]